MIRMSWNLSQLNHIHLNGFSAAAYNTAFYGFVMFEGDEFEGNNVSKSHFVRINPDIDFSILVWDNDNDIETIICPVQGDEIQPSTALKRVLDEAGFEYNVVHFLPDDLDTYDMVFLAPWGASV